MRKCRHFILLAAGAFVCASCASEGSNGWRQSAVDSLVVLGHQDQEGREKIAQAVVAQDTAFIFASMRTDSARSRWLRAEIQKNGWPTRASVGDSASNAAWLILQHSPFSDWQSEMLPTLEQLAERGEIQPSSLAMLSDRVRVRRGEPQRYGSHFDSDNGKLVPAPIADLPGLDARRAAVGLPPMTEYVRVLGEVYKLPVVWPPPR